MLEKTIEAIGTVIQDQLSGHKGEISKILDRDESVAIAVAITIEGRPVELDLKMKMTYTLEKRVITHEEKISETQHELFPQGKEVKAT